MLQLLTEHDLLNFFYIPSYRDALTTSVLLKAAVRMFLKGRIWALTVCKLVISVCVSIQGCPYGLPLVLGSNGTVCSSNQSQTTTFPSRRPGQGGQKAKNIFLNLTEIIQTSLTCCPSFMQVSLKRQFSFIYSLSCHFKPCALFYKSSEFTSEHTKFTLPFSFIYRK